MKLQSYALVTSFVLCVWSMGWRALQEIKIQEGDQLPEIPTISYSSDGLVSSVRVKSGNIVDAVCYDRASSDQALHLLDEHPTLKEFYNKWADQVCWFTVKEITRESTHYIVKEWGIVRLFMRNGNRLRIIHRMQT